MVARIMRKQRGFSLIELVVVTGLVGLLSVGLVNMFLSSVRGSQRARLQAEIKSQGDYALASMERVLRNVTATPSPCGPTQLEAVVRKSGSGQAAETETYVYAGNSSSLDLSVDGVSLGSLFTAPVVVEAVNFECPQAAVGEAGRIVVEFTLGVVDGSVPSQSFQTTISIRNNY